MSDTSIIDKINSDEEIKGMIADSLSNLAYKQMGKVGLYTAYMGYNIAKVTWQVGASKLFKKAGKQSLMKLSQRATKWVSSSSRLANVLGLFDIAGDLLVKSNADKGWWSMIPMMGIIELGAGLYNYIDWKVTGTNPNLMNADFAWNAIPD